MVGTTVSHYRIVEKLGAGGMGVVYKAEDLTLGRTVALKFLPPELTQQSEARERFVHEARAASALEHANICSIHEIGEHDGQTFIVMGCYEGEILKMKIGRGPLPIEEAVAIARQVAQGLAKAHEAGIVHRDIKPANIIVTSDGLVKILDFGLAKIAGRTLLTKSGSTLGTAAYMSPEQARGDPVDLRTDIWSLGVILYEMLTGRRPFDNEYEQALVYTILNQDPKSVQEMRPEVPEGLAKIVRRTLSKEQERRYQTAAELISDLELFSHGAELSKQTRRIPSKRRTLIISGAAGVAAIAVIVVFFFFHSRTEILDSIAVLPMQDLSHDSTQEYFSDGLTEELITKLWQVGTLRVPHWVSVRQYKNSQKPLSQIGKELGVRGLIVPTMLRIGDRIRITPSLIDVSTENIIWTKDYERESKDILTLQSEISQAIVKAVSAKLLPVEEARLASSYEVRPEAHDAYLKGMSLLNKDSFRNAHRAQDQFRRAIELDSNFALAYLGYSRAVAAAGEDMTLPPEEAYPVQMASLTKAIEKDPNLAEAHAALGALEAYHDYNLGAGEVEIRLAVDINPGSAAVHRSFGGFLAATGHYEHAIEELKKEISLSPPNAENSIYLAQIHFFYRHFDEAIAVLREILDVVPDSPDAHILLGFVFIVQGRYTEALTELQIGTTRNFESQYDHWGYAWLYARMGDKQKAREYLNKLVAYDAQHYFNSTLIAAILGELGEKDRAFEYLDKAYTRRELTLVSWMKAGPAFDSLRSDPRYTALMKKIGLER
jgi:serine/threonine protein kinase/tetratricopeptide (TPR) repeat protein